jgi:hypothetical protein
MRTWSRLYQVRSPPLDRIFSTDQPYDPKTPETFREATNAYFRRQAAEFIVAVQLNTGLNDMPIEDAQAKWFEDLSRYQAVARGTMLFTSCTPE